MFNLVPDITKLQILAPYKVFSLLFLLHLKSHFFPLGDCQLIPRKIASPRVKRENIIIEKSSKINPN